VARQPAEWMTPLDERILELMAAEGWATPASVARRVSLRASVARVRERCVVLTQAGLVAPVSRQRRHHAITGAGRRYLDGRLDARTLPRPVAECD